MPTRTGLGAGVVVLLALASGTVACGKKGPPLAPLRPVPAAPSEVTARRSETDVTLRLRIPSAGVDPALPLSLSRVEIYARSVPAGSPRPTVEQLLDKENLVHSIDVRPPADPEQMPTPAAAAVPAPVDSRPAPGDVVSWTDAVPSTPPRPLDLTRTQEVQLANRIPLWVPTAPSGLFVPMTPVRLPARYYVAVGVSERRRTGPASVMLAVPMGPAPLPPSAPTITYTEAALTVSWTPAATGVPVAVLESSPSGDPLPVVAPVTPTATGTWSTPVTFGTPRCFVVRSVVPQGAVTIESASAGPVCETPVDTFPPPPPTNLEVLPSTDGVRLVWDAPVAPDVAGYRVLRGEGAGETLLPLTTDPVTTTQWSDTTTRPGTRYVYVVVAVDAAGNPSAQSNRAVIERFAIHSTSSRH